MTCKENSAVQHSSPGNEKPNGLLTFAACYVDLFLPNYNEKILVQI